MPIGFDERSRTVEHAMRIANSVRGRRQEAGLTQEDLAVQCGVSRQTIIALEKGGYEPSLGLAMRVARALAVSVDELFSLEDAPS